MRSGLKSGLDDGVADLVKNGWSVERIRVWVIGEIGDYNSSGMANPHPVEVRELNDYLSNCNPPMETVNEDADAVVKANMN